MLTQTSVRFLGYSLVALGLMASVHAVDFHAFEFNEGSGVELPQTTNTGSPGLEGWVESNNLTESETDGLGNFKIAKFSDIAADNYLQIDNITSATAGSRYIVVRMSGWHFVDSVVGQGEEIRFDFLDNDTGIDGSSVTSQVRIDRNTDNGNIELRGTAIGVGSANVLYRSTLNTTQTAPFTMVLELNKTSNTYEIFYKDGTNPSQALGTAPIAPDRNGNSIRFTVNNNFGSDLDEFFSIDRIALSDTNPLTDLLTLEVDRITGEMKLKNTTGAALSGLRSYSITSPAGALNASNWKSVTDNYDQAPQNGSVDIDGAWAKTSTTTAELSEGVIGGNGGNLSINQEVILSMGTGPWIKSPFEDLDVVLQFDGGIMRKANVNFIGNNDKRFTTGDLNFDGQLTAADWTAFIAGSETLISSLTQAQRYQAGDFNDDGENNIFDFAIFKNAYETANGLGSFNAMLSSVPEPSGLALASLGSFLLAFRRNRQSTRHQQSKSTATRPALEVAPMKSRHVRIILPTFALLSMLTVASVCHADILEDFQFGDANGTLLGSSANSANTGNVWNEDPNDSVNSSVLNGDYRIQKNNNDLTTHILDIDNITTGKAWIVTEISGWNFSSLVGPGEFDSGELEDFRLSFLDNDSPNQGGSFITGQATIQRNSTGGIELVGRLTTGVPEFGPLALTLNRSTPFTMVLEIDENAENYSIYYKDNTGPYTLLGTAPHVAGRNGNSLRWVVNNNFGGTGEFFDVDRVYLTDTNPTNVSADLLTLQVNTGTGEIKLMNEVASTIEIDSYRITSSTLDLNFAGWNSLSDHNPLINPVDGPDGDLTMGNGIGETWDEAAGSNNGVLAESFLLGSSIFTTGRTETLGTAFKIGGDDESLAFQYRNADTGAIVSGNIEFISTSLPGDFDADGDVDGRDFLRWQRGGSPNPLSASDLAAWRTNYGNGPLAALQAVPEPSVFALMTCLAVGILAARRKQ